MRARGGTRTGLWPLQTLGTPENISNPSQSGRCTSQPETKSVDTVNTFFLLYPCNCRAPSEARQFCAGRLQVQSGITIHRVRTT
jgi:hypothetical protein